MPQRVTFRRRSTNARAQPQQSARQSVPRTQIVLAPPPPPVKKSKKKVPKNQNPGAVLGDSLWTAGKTLFKDILGWGDYSINRNSVMGGSTQVPTMHGDKDSVRIRHREYIGDVTMTSAFTTTTYAVNPGLQATFPWLSGMAASFQEYDICGMVFDYTPTSGQLSTATTPALGNVTMACQYRADQPAFSSKLTMLNSEFSVDGRPSDNVLFPIECSPKEKPLQIQYIRTNALGPNQDIKFYDLGIVTLATSGGNATQYVSGELWVTYDVILYKPTGSAISSGNPFQLNWESAAPTSANPFASTAVYNYQGGPFDRVQGTGSAAGTAFATDGGLVSSQANFGIITLPIGCVGTFKLTIVMNCTSSTITTPGSVSFSSGCTAMLNDSNSLGAFNIQGTYQNTLSLPAAGTTAQTNQIWLGYFTISASQAALSAAVIKYGNAGGMTVGTAPFLSAEIVQINSNFTVV
jgi:hypothetical protein